MADVPADHAECLACKQVKPNGEFASSQIKKKKAGERKCKECVSGGGAAAAPAAGEGAGASDKPAAPVVVVDKSPEAFLKMAMEAGGFLGACVSLSKGEAVKVSPEINAADAKDLDHQMTDLACLFKSKAPHWRMNFTSMESSTHKGYAVQDRDKSVAGCTLMPLKDPASKGRVIALLTPKIVLAATFDFSSAGQEEEQMDKMRAIREFAMKK
jgi:hypothetical protein